LEEKEPAKLVDVEQITGEVVLEDMLVEVVVESSSSVVEGFLPRFKPGSLTARTTTNCTSRKP